MDSTIAVGGMTIVGNFKFSAGTQTIGGVSVAAISIDADATAAEAAQTLLRERIHRLLVTEEGQPVGIISAGDFVAGVAEAPTVRQKVADVMSRGIVVCREGTTLGAVAWAMTERRSRSVVVISREGRPLGVITGLDILEACQDGCGDRTVEQVMHPPVTIHPEATLQQAAESMIQHHIHRLVVVEQDRPEALPLGLISTSDIVVGMARSGSVWQA